MKKNLYIAFGFLFFLQGCAQEKKEQTMNILTTTQRIDYLKKNIQRYDYEPLYYIDVETNYNYQVLVNDFPVYTNFDYELKGGMIFNINKAILQSGKQKLEIRIYPESINEVTRKEFLDTKGYFKLQITQTAWRKDGGGQEEPKIIMEYELPKENKHIGNTIDYAKLKSFTDSLSFEATVPYHLQGWTNGEVFKEEDSLQLKVQVAAFYQDIREAFEKEEHNYIRTKYLEANKEWYQSEYFPDDLIQSLQDGSHVKKKYKKRYFPLENYKLSIYGDGRILCLETISGENKGNSALGYTYENENREGIRFLDLYLYRPKGSSQFQIIR
ncbi:hypothetical protein [Apibacter adventoris]|uniref:Uncharacterized protein n=1 Tax=Apibacter adventoris TaxID=1679466 RepID=A0A2S8A8M5_9FLAO|nr:hypothetical protein [Apibacter adventoris]PQL90913.1 hypothetical protein C4S77_09605 [Apibacter adventoris]